MIKKLVFLLLVLLLATCSNAPKLSPTPQVDVSQEEQAVYAAVLAKLYAAKYYVFLDTTATDPGGVSNTPERIDYIKKNLHDFDQATLDNFLSRNDKAYAVSPDMKLGVSYAVVSQEQVSQFFGQNQDGWETFYKNYPDAPGLTGLSRVGFNADFTQAIVYVGTQSHYLAGAGYYVLLNKVGGVWTFDQQVMSWIS